MRLAVPVAAPVHDPEHRVSVDVCNDNKLKGAVAAKQWIRPSNAVNNAESVHPLELLEPRFNSMTSSFLIARTSVVWLSLSLSVSLAGVTPAAAARLALVIGSDDYQHVNSLTNAGNDAQLIAKTLRGAGFDIVGAYG
jgi:hypothetical protein